MGQHIIHSQGGMFELNGDPAFVAGGMLWYLHNEIIWHHWIRVAQIDISLTACTKEIGG